MKLEGSVEIAVVVVMVVVVVVVLLDLVLSQSFIRSMT